MGEREKTLDRSNQSAIKGNSVVAMITKLDAKLSVTYTVVVPNDSVNQRTWDPL